MDVFDLKGVLTLDSSKFESGLRSAGNMASSFGSGLVSGFKKMATVTTAALGAVSAASGAFLKDAVQTGMAFDTMMGQVGATMGKDVEDMEQEMGKVEVRFGDTVKTFEGTLREFALFMGQNTKFSATEAAQALNYMALAGYETEQSMQMLPAVLNMAAAGAMDLGRASDMITDTQSALGLSFERTNQMVDEFAKAASSGNTTVEMLGEAFLKVGGLAKELNGGMVQLSDGTWAELDGIQELEVAFTAMANAGVKGNEAGTHMRNMLLKLSSPTKDGRAAFEELGVSVFDAEGKMRSLADIFYDLNMGLSSVTQAEKLQAIGEIFNARDTASAEALLGAIEGTVQYEGQVYAISTAYEKWGDAIYDVNQGFVVTQSSWDHLGEAILDSEGAAAAMSSRQLNNLQGSITLFKSALETAKITVSDKITPALREFVDFGTEGLQKLVDGFNENGLTGAMDAFGEILSDGLVKVIEKLPNLTNVAGNILKSIGKGLMDNMDAVSEAATSILTLIAEMTLKGFPAFLKIMGGVLGKFGEWIINNADLILDGIESVITTVLDFIDENADSFFEGVGELLGKIAERLPKLITTLVRALPKVIRQLSKAIVDNAPILIKGATDCVIAIVRDLPEILKALLEEAPNILISIVTSLVENIPVLVRELIGFVGKLIEDIPEIVAGIINYIPKFIGLLFDTKNGFLSEDNIREFVNGGISLVAKLVLKIPEMIEQLLTEGIPDIIGKILGAFGIDVNDPDSLAGKLYGLFKSAMETAGEAFGFLSTAAQEVFDLIVLVFQDPAGALKRALDDMVTLVRNAASELIKAINTYYEAWLGWIEVIKGQEYNKLVRERIAKQAESLRKQGYVVLQDEKGYISEILTPGTKAYDNYMANHPHSSGGKYFGEGPEPTDTTGQAKINGSNSIFGTRGDLSSLKNLEPGVIAVDWWGRPIEEKKPEEVNVNLNGNATVTVEGAGDEKTFKQVNNAVMKKVKQDARFVDFE